MAQKIKTLWANFTKSPEQKYLEQAVDLVDLEQRLKKLSVERKSEMAKFKGRSVRLNKPTRIRKGQTSYGRKKFQVFVNDGGRTKRVTFGDPNMRIKKSSPARRKSFRARHKCATPGPKTKARYWSCKKW